MQHFDTELFLRTIHQKKSLWDVSSEEYKNRQLAKRDWDEVATATCPWLDILNEKQKSSTINELQKKWRNIRDSYVRYLRAVRTNSGRKTWKPYIYAKNLEFLNSHITQSMDACSPGIKSEEESVEKADDGQVYDGSEASTMESEGRVYKGFDDHECHGGASASFFPLLQERYENIDSCDDMNFFRSLLPMVRNLPMKDKLKFRVDVMNLLLENIKS